MALSVVQRPQGFIVKENGLYDGVFYISVDTANSFTLSYQFAATPLLEYRGDAFVSVTKNGSIRTATVTNSGGFAYFTVPNHNYLDDEIVTVSVQLGTYTKGSSVITCESHGLITGKIIYIKNNEAIGFWYVTPLTVDTFNIREYAEADVYTFVGTGSLNYSASVAGHGWNCVHLPIVYKLKSTSWPTNSVDTARTVSSYSNDNGYVKLTCSGVLNSGISELEFVKVTFTGGTSAVYQVIGFYSTSIVTINLAYVGGLTFTSVQYYYNNYHARIRVYAGLSSSHYFTSQKPYELITEQRVIPDEDGIVTFNINEFLKEKIAILNNDLLKGTLQNNLDAFCQFYITYAEGYDYTEGGYTLMDFVSSYTTDSFTGYAVNAELPFKNLHSGYLSDYVYGSSATKLKFLTPSLYPEITPGQFFDISFVNQIGALLRIRREVLQNGVIVNTFFDAINDYGVGIYRYEIDQSIYLEDQIYITLEFYDYVNWIPISETKVITINNECSDTPINFSWLNNLGGFDYWTFKSDSDYGVNIESTKAVKKNIFTNWPKSYGKGASTINQQTQRTSRQVVTVRAENLTEEQVSDLFRIRTSPLVQIVTSPEDRRTVIVDGGSFVYLQQREKLFSLEFQISYTDNLPAQSL